MNQDQNQYSIDYLNQIAPPTKKPGMSQGLFLAIVIGGGLLAVIVGAMMFLGGGSTGPSRDTQVLAARLEVLREVSDKSRKNIKSSDLRGTNSNLTIFLANAYRDIAEPMQIQGMDIKKIDSTITSTEKAAGEELSAKLEDARLNAIFDRVYAAEMHYELEKIAGLMQKIHTNTSSKSMKEYLVTTDEYLQPIKQQLEDFNTVNSD